MNSTYTKTLNMVIAINMKWFQTRVVIMNFTETMNITQLNEMIL